MDNRRPSVDTNEPYRVDTAHLRKMMEAGATQKTHPLFPVELRALLDAYDELAALKARIALLA